MLKNTLLAYTTVITLFFGVSEFIYAQGSSENRAIWLSFPYWDLTGEEKELLSKDISKAGVNTAYLAVYGSAKVRWPSEALKKLGLSDIKSNDGSRGVKILRKNGIRVVPWFEQVYLYESTEFSKENLIFFRNAERIIAVVNTAARL